MNEVAEGILWNNFFLHLVLKNMMERIQSTNNINECEKCVFT